MKKIDLDNGDVCNLNLSVELRNVHYKHISFDLDALSDAVKVFVNCFLEEKGEKL